MNTSPKALVAGTAVRRLFALPPHSERNAERPPPARGLAVCGVLGDGRRENGRRFPKRDSQGSGPLSGCGQSPPFPLRDDFVDTAVPWSAGRHASVPRARRPTTVQGQTAPQTTFSRDKPMIRRAILSSAFAPQGQTASNTHPRSAPCPTGARQRRPTRRRRQAPAREPVTVCPHTRPKRNAPQPACPRRMGQTGVTPAPTALSAGTAGLPPQKPPQATGSCS